MTARGPFAEQSDAPVDTRWARVIAAPDRVLLVFLAIATALGISVTIGAFRPWVVIPMAILALVATRRWMPTRVAGGVANGLFSLASLFVAVGWIAVNVPFVGQLLQPVRDPGIYTVTGIWLIGHPSPAISVTAATHLAAGISAAGTNLGHFGHTPSGIVQLQGGDLLPAFMGAAGWVGGIPAALAINVVIGGVALIALFGLLRRFVGSGFALLAQVILGLSFPMMYLSRSPYSEIIMLAVCIAALTWLASAFASGRRGQFLAAGAFAGAAGLTRIDGPLAVIGIQVAVLVLAFGFLPVTQREQFARGMRAFSVIAIVYLAVGVADLELQKPAYLKQHLGETALLWAAMIAVTIAAELAWRSAAGRPEISPRVLRRLSVGLGAAVAAVLVFWVSRPLWMVNRYQQGTGLIAVEAMQRAEHLAIDPYRSYEEFTFIWVAWYFGWPFLVSCIAGLVLLVVLAMRRKNYPALIIVATALAAAALYFTRVNITPDQPWAYRRLLPIITPGLLFGAMFLLSEFWARRRIWSRVVSLALAASFIGAQVLILNPLILTPDGSGEYQQVQAVCSAIHHKTVVFATVGGYENYAVTLRTVCDVNVIEVGAGVTASQLETIATRAGGVDAVINRADTLPGSATPGRPVATGPIYTWEQQLIGAPAFYSKVTQSVWVGTIGADGRYQAADK